MTQKDWTGNTRSSFAALGARTYATHEREEHDYYATEPKAGEMLLELEPDLNNIWECACGEGHLANVFQNAEKLGLATDLIDRGYGKGNVNFLGNYPYQWNGDIVTNPPYKYAQEFVEKAISIIPDGRKVCMFLKVLFLEGKARKKLFEKYPPKTVYVSSSRLKCALNGEFKKIKGTAVAYAWFIWEKGYKGKTTVKWFN